MKELNHLDKDFAKIAELFQNYKDALLSKNNDSALSGYKEKIVIKFWKTIQKTSLSEEMKGQSEEIIEKIIYCINKYGDKEAVEFTKITYVSIVNELKKSIDKESFEGRIGVTISEDRNRLRKQIENEYKNFYRVNSSEDKNAFIEYAEKYLGFKKKDLKDFIFPRKSVSLVSYNNNNEEYNVADVSIDISNTEDTAQALVNKESFEALITDIENLWLQQKQDARPIFSELLTVIIIKELIQANAPEDWFDLLNDTSFLCRDIFQDFISRLDFELPSQDAIAEKYGLTKSGVSKKISRFLEKLNE